MPADRPGKPKVLYKGKTWTCTQYGKYGNDVPKALRAAFDRRAIELAKAANRVDG